MTGQGEARREELAANLAAVRARIDAARVAAGREDAIRLVTVTKTFPSSDVDLLASLGVTDVGENRDQEARRKHDECTVGARAVVWHMIGQLQRNKASSVVRWADCVETIDRARLIPALGRAAAAADRRIAVLLQVNIDPEPTPGRGGALPADVPGLAALAADEQALDLQGVMAVAPNPAAGVSPYVVEAAFDRLREVSERLRGEYPTATTISAGMSGDLELAIAHGATQVRIGGAILGSRGSVQ